MQNRNSYNKVEDFLKDDSFKKWVLHDEDTQNWEAWTLDNPERGKIVDEARLWILAMKIEETPISNTDIQIALHKTWGKINDLQNTKQTLTIWQSKWLSSVAAILVIGISSFLYFIYSNHQSSSTIAYNELIEQSNDRLIEQINNSDKPQLITLSDASSVLLQPQSKLSYPKNFDGNSRKVYLSGEGFFEIAKDAKKPFYVYANEVVTKVYGTSFRVIAYSNQPNVEILVRTGKVKVSSNREIQNVSKEEVTLLPNQAARFVRNSLTFEKIFDITKDEPLHSPENAIELLSFEFNDTPVSQIFRTLEQGYSVNINFPTDNLKECYLTTSLSDEPLPEKLKIICESLGNNTRYEMNGNQITIFSKGCK
jgi:hypothetical protein